LREESTEEFEPSTDRALLTPVMETVPRPPVNPNTDNGPALAVSVPWLVKEAPCTVRLPPPLACIVPWLVQEPTLAYRFPPPSCTVPWLVKEATLTVRYPRA